MSVPKFYLAGPEVFQRDPIAAGAALKALCAQHGATGLYPMDNEFGDSAAAVSGAALAAQIRTANMSLIRAADAVVANMAPFRGPSMDVGTAYELGVAAALGKIVVGYVPGGAGAARCYLERVREVCVLRDEGDGQLRDEQGMSVEDFTGEGGVGERRGLVDNLMLACGVEALCESAEEAIKAAVEIWELKKKGGFVSKVVG